MEQHEARMADRCETGKGCCALGVLESECDFRNEKSMELLFFKLDIKLSSIQNSTVCPIVLDIIGLL